VTSWLTLLFLVSVLVLMAFDYPNGTYTIASIPLIAVVLVLGWFGVRKRVHAEAMKEHDHHHDDQDDAPPTLAEDRSR
jgi:Gamma-aminobutyrate permease and related permeases